jgi:hypothetical protein
LCEPLVWVTTGVEGEPELGTEAGAPLAAVVTGDGDDEEELEAEPVEDEPVVGVAPEAPLPPV